MGVPNKGQLIAAAWEDYVKTDPQDQIFQYFWLLENLKVGDSSARAQATRSPAPSSTPSTRRSRRWPSWNPRRGSRRCLRPLRIRMEVRRRPDRHVRVRETDHVGWGGQVRSRSGKIENLKKTMQQTINNDLYSDGTGSGGKQAGGLQYLVSTTPTVGHGRRR
jgi:hypothetical protein